ncbi:MAG: 3-isopropylmalate dehydratase small subunit [Gemmatimonadetes bacterium]|nr:3-isopropylmalate dehydratase small subunit [Gemmatimonadota bacterium]
MQPFTVHTGIAAVLPRVNVDTDQIIPKQFLKRIERTGFGKHLFHDWRYLPDGSPNPGFELNAPQAAGASILVAGPNFGCGSSREHAPWALADYGFRAVIAPSFADIFYNNCCQNGLLAVRLEDAAVRALFALGERGEPFELTVDLRINRVTGPAGFRAGFDMDPYRRQMLLEGLDEIGQTLRQELRIAAYERRMEALGRLV